MEETPNETGAGGVSGLKTELTAAVAIVGAMLVGMGYLLVWARLQHEELPSETVLASLPPTFFAGVAFQVLLYPLPLVALVLALWAVLLRDQDKARLTSWATWAVFGGILWLTCWYPLSVHGTGTEEPTRYHAIALVVSAVSATLVRMMARSIATERLPRAASRLIVIASVLVAFFNQSAAHVADALWSPREFPLAQVVTGSRCSALTGGLDLPGDRCRLGGFYIGESGDAIFVFQTPPDQDLCPSPRSEETPAQPEKNQRDNHFLAVARSNVEQVVLRRTLPPCEDQARLKTTKQP